MMIEKHLRQIFKPFHTFYYNGLIKRARQKTSNLKLDEIVPDQREEWESDEEKIKHVGLRILRCIQFLAEEYDFSFMLAYGTLLGSIRHQGFIPWDDDIDIFMTKSDFKRFIEVSNNLPEGLKFFGMEVGFFKVMDRSSRVSMDGKRGVAVDIFILKEDQGRKKHYFYNVHTQKNLYFKSDKIFPLKKKDFEGFPLYIPKESDFMLTQLYGDYMKLPPLEQRVSHHSNSDSIIIAEYGKTLSF